MRLPTGIFYSQGVKTNVLFFQRGKTHNANTKAVWVYDMRANMPAFGKTRLLTVADFADFEVAYGNDPNGGAKRNDQGEEGRWRSFTREQIKARSDNLDIGWLRDTEAEAEEHVLFFQRGKTHNANTKAVWVYDMRANMPAFGKTRLLTVADFADFEVAYGNDPNGGAKRNDQGEEGRWRSFTREQIKARSDNLDIGWPPDTEAEAEEQLTEPEDIAAAIIGHLKAALEDIETLSDELEPDGIEEPSEIVEAAE